MPGPGTHRHAPTTVASASPPDPRGRLAAVRAGRLLVAALTAASVLGAPVTAQAQVPPPRVIWVNPAGSDARDGATRTTAVRTLARAHQLLCPADRCPGLGVPVEIRLEPGTHHLPDTKWQYFDDTYPTRFVPAGWRPGWTWTQVSAAGGRPRLDGRWTTKLGLQFSPRRASSTSRNNLEFHYLEWRRYIHYALEMRGSGAGPQPAGNLVNGNLFIYIGNWWRPEQPLIGYGGIGLNFAKRNTVANSHFVSIVNRGVGLGHEHGVYLMRAYRNVFRNNRFEDVGGDPVRFRFASSQNLVENSTFRKTGTHAYLGDCCAADANPDYRSWGNIGRGNRYLGPYAAQPGFRIAYCYDLRAACPPSRIKIEP